jgi:hypothetical protein
MKSVGVACHKYDLLKQERKIALDSVNVFQPLNRLLHKYSDRKASKLRKAAQQRVFELAEQMATHLATCEVCKREQAGSEL